MLALAALLLAPAPAVAGLYQSQQMEVGAVLELKADGRFRYQLDYGAVSEQAEGRWASDGKAVRLTTAPAPKPPAFELVSDDAAPTGELTVTVEPPGLGGYRLDAIATDAKTGEKGRVRVDSDGKVDSGGHTISILEPMVPVYGTIAGRFPLDPRRGHRLLLRFRANDLGTAVFSNELLTITPRGLVLNRYDQAIRFIRVRP
jgi:hypothetical protein